jgi:6-phosphogluconate dehydrogenase
MKRGLGMTYKEMGEEFAKWNKGVLDSFLIEITRDVLQFNDDDGKPLVEKILDSAGQKGTGKWTAINALVACLPSRRNVAAQRRSSADPSPASLETVLPSSRTLSKVSMPPKSSPTLKVSC